MLYSELQSFYWFGGRAVWGGGQESAVEHRTRRSWVRLPRQGEVGMFSIRVGNSNGFSLLPNLSTSHGNSTNSAPPSTSCKYYRVRIKILLLFCFPEVTHVSPQVDRWKDQELWPAPPRAQTRPETLAEGTGYFDWLLPYMSLYTKYPGDITPRATEIHIAGARYQTSPFRISCSNCTMFGKNQTPRQYVYLTASENGA